MNISRYYKSPIGLLCAETEAEKLVSLTVAANANEAPSTSDALSGNLQYALDAYFSGCTNAFDTIPIAPHGSPFEKSVWDALRTVSFGEVRTYGEIASMIGKPTAARAVGGACHRNPILLLIPCHRIIGGGGKLTGFGCGLEKKILLLKHEHHQIEKEYIIQ